MKYNPYDDEVTGDRRTGRPPLQAATKYRQQQQRGKMFEDLKDETIGSFENNETPANVDGAEPSSKSEVHVDDQAGDDEGVYHPTTSQKTPHRKP